MIVVCFCGEQFEVDLEAEMGICPKCNLFHDDLKVPEDLRPADDHEDL